MNPDPRKIRDPDLRAVDVALRRAGARARELGRLMKTPVYVIRDGKIVDLTAEWEQSQRDSHSKEQPSSAEQ